MRRIIFFIICLFFLLLSGCLRPDESPSPFDVLAKEFESQAAIPDEPVIGPAFEIIPDTVLVYGQSTAGFSVKSVLSNDSILLNYSEEVEEDILTGAEILEKISRDYSVNPRLLLALIEYSSGWVTGDGSGSSTEYPINPADQTRKGLFRQLSWTANELNRGFYSSRVGGLESFSLADGVEVIVSPEINDATASLQYVLGQMMGYHDWQSAVGSLGLYTQYLKLFGNPEDNAYRQIEFEDLAQPEFSLPFSSSDGWFFTSGPHSAWGDGAAWAALDFAPDEEKYGCYQSDAWVLAAADGLIVRSIDGAVVQDLNGDGHEGSGWTILYMHIAELGRVEEGVHLQAGERIGHPSCEGGPSNGTHLHLARRFNGEWIPADQDLPFTLSGWVSAGVGVEYDGSLSRDGQVIYSSGFPTDENKIYH